MEAAAPVVSVILFAARPVGAASAIAGILERISPSIKRTMVVLPVPGPPVIISTLS